MVQAIDPKKLKDMKPHEELIAGDCIRMIRVVGGWIYWRTYQQELITNEGSSISCALAGVFVPENVFSPASVS